MVAAAPPSSRARGGRQQRRSSGWRRRKSGRRGDCRHVLDLEGEDVGLLSREDVKFVPDPEKVILGVPDRPDGLFADHSALAAGGTGDYLLA